MIKTFLDQLYYAYEVFSHYLPFFAEAYVKFHEPSVKKEIVMLQLSSSDKVLHIGCGAIPYTSIVIAREIGAQVTGIDHKLRVVMLSMHCIKQRKLLDLVAIKKEEGKTCDVSGFDVIIISYGIANQDVVLQHVLDSSKAGSRILLRRSTAKNHTALDALVKELSIDSIRVLLTQESILIVKKEIR
jgi:protein-L-isoaspartate O-methyltransferase